MTEAEEKARREAALSKFESAATILHTFVHGDDTTIINTESGPLPSLAKINKDLGTHEASAVEFITQVRDTMANLP